MSYSPHCDRAPSCDAGAIGRAQETTLQAIRAAHSPACQAAMLPFADPDASVYQTAAWAAYSV